MSSTVRISMTEDPAYYRIKKLMAKEKRPEVKKGLLLAMFQYRKTKGEMAMSLPGAMEPIKPEVDVYEKKLTDIMEAEHNPDVKRGLKVALFEYQKVKRIIAND